MKKFFTILAICLGFGTIEAQNFWKPIDVPGEFLGAAENGDMFCYMGYCGLHRSQDEGATWDSIYHMSYVNASNFTISRHGRIYIFNENENSQKLWYSDDNGDNWQEQVSGISRNWVNKIYSVSNDTIFLCSDNILSWTMNGGVSWSETTLNFINENMPFVDLVANNMGEVFVCNSTEIFSATLENMNLWELKATANGIDQIVSDNKGNIIAKARYSHFSYQNGIYITQSDTKIALSRNDIIFTAQRTAQDNMALLYSTDHGENYTPINGGDFYSLASGPEEDCILIGNDQHLYCFGYYFNENNVRRQYYKSERIADETIENFPIGTKWYYEITNDNGSVTYQYLECAADTAINSTRPKVMIKSNTLYDKDLYTKITHEYIYSDGGIVYWWDKQSQSYTTLYNFYANAGDEWTIHVGNQSITIHVDDVNYTDYEGKTYRVLTVSDENDIFSGDIICGIGHTKSFFPEKLLNNKSFSVDGMRCYWQNGEQVIQLGNVDCDEIYKNYNDVAENDEMKFAVYPNPANNVISISFNDVQTQFIELQYEITNTLGQTVMKGFISSENQQINTSDLENGMYFIKIGGMTIKFIKE